MRDLGKIVNLSGDMAEVSISPHGGCENCVLKSSCSPGETTRLLWAQNPGVGKVGDEVVVELKPEVKVFGSALVFILPLIGLFIGYLIGISWGGNSDYAVLGALIGLVVFFGLVRLVDGFLSKKHNLKPTITQVLS